MKQNLRSHLILAALCIIFGCAGAGYAQTDGPITGGYATTDNSNPDVIAAAKYAAKNQAKKQGVKIKFISVNKAEMQVVAGLNYRICMNVEIKEKGKKTYMPRLVRTVVYKDLKQKLSPTSWDWGECNW